MVASPEIVENYQIEKEPFFSTLSSKKIDDGNVTISVQLLKPNIIDTEKYIYEIYVLSI